MSPIDNTDDLIELNLEHASPQLRTRVKDELSKLAPKVKEGETRPVGYGSLMQASIIVRSEIWAMIKEHSTAFHLVKENPFNIFLINSALWGDSQIQQSLLDAFSHCDITKVNNFFADQKSEMLFQRLPKLKIKITQYLIQKLRDKKLDWDLADLAVHESSFSLWLMNSNFWEDPQIQKNFLEIFSIFDIKRINKFFDHSRTQILFQRFPELKLKITEYIAEQVKNKNLDGDLINLKALNSPRVSLEVTKSYNLDFILKIVNKKLPALPEIFKRSFVAYLAHVSDLGSKGNRDAESIMYFILHVEGMQLLFEPLAQDDGIFIKFYLNSMEYSWDLQQVEAFAWYDPRLKEFVHPEHKRPLSQDEKRSIKELGAQDLSQIPLSWEHRRRNERDELEKRKRKDTEEEAKSKSIYGGF